MSKIYVCLSDVRNANYKIPSLSSKVNSVKRAVGLLRYRVPDDVAGRYRIKQRINSIYMELGKIEDQINELYAVTNSCMDQYAQIEQKNSKNANAFD